MASTKSPSAASASLTAAQPQSSPSGAVGRNTGFKKKDKSQHLQLPMNVVASPLRESFFSRQSAPFGGVAQDGRAEDSSTEGGTKREKLGPTHNINRSVMMFVDGDTVFYAIIALMVLNLAQELLILLFAARADYPGWGLWVLTLSSLLYLAETTMRMSALRSFFFKSRSNIGEFTLVICTNVLTFIRVSHRLSKGQLAPDSIFRELGPVIFISVTCIRLILKPYSKVFTSKVLQLDSQHTLRISIESLKDLVTSMPGLTNTQFDAMVMQIVIACGSETGYMTTEEFMLFLERALPHRPPGMSATLFLSYMQSVGMDSQEDAYGTMDVILSTLRHWSFQRWDLTMTLIIVVINAMIAPAQALFIKYILNEALSPAKAATDAAVVGVPTPKGGTVDAENALIKGMGGLLFICIPYIMCNLGIGYYQAKMIANASNRIQMQLADIVLHKNSKFFLTHSEGDLNNLFTGDLARVNALWQAVFWNLMNPGVSIVFALGYIIYTDWANGIIGFMLIAVLLSSGPQDFAAKKSKEFVGKSAYVAAEFQNGISCHKIIKAFDIFQPYLDRFSRHCDKLRRSAIGSQLWATVVQTYISGMVFVYVIIQISAAAYNLFYNHNISLGDFAALISLYQNLANPVITLGGFMRWAIGSAGSLQRLDDIIFNKNEKDSDKDGSSPSSDLSAVFKKGKGTVVKRNEDSNKMSLPSMKHYVALHDIKFRYNPDSDVFTLDGLSLKFMKGTYNCIVGASGGGKTTVLNILLGFEKQEQGTIAVDGLDIASYTRKSFMDRLGVVFQNIMIINGTIMDNIRYGCINATDEECVAASRAAECHDFILSLADGYNTVVGQHATTSLSGGQAQRLCLARALCRKPDILLLDEATSALDPETEHSIVQTFENLAKQKQMTIISVTHRYQTTVNADAIFVLKDGIAVEKGTYKQLTQAQGYFAEILALRENGRLPVEDKELNAHVQKNLAGGMRRALNRQLSVAAIQKSMYGGMPPGLAGNKDRGSLLDYSVAQLEPYGEGNRESLRRRALTASPARKSPSRQTAPVSTYITGNQDAALSTAMSSEARPTAVPYVDGPSGIVPPITTHRKDASDAEKAEDAKQALKGFNQYLRAMSFEVAKKNGRDTLRASLAGDDFYGLEIIGDDDIHRVDVDKQPMITTPKGEAGVYQPISTSLAGPLVPERVGGAAAYYGATPGSVTASTSLYGGNSQSIVGRRQPSLFHTSFMVQDPSFTGPRPPATRYF